MWQAEGRRTDTYLFSFPFHQYWDLRQQAPVITVNLPERCYTMDVQFPLMVVGCAERHVQIYNLTNPGTVYRVRFFSFDSFLTSDTNLGTATTITFEMADSGGFVLSESRWVRYWECGRESGNPVRLVTLFIWFQALMRTTETLMTLNNSKYSRAHSTTQAHDIQPANRSNFSFKCHRKDQLPAKDKTLVYSVNDINFHPVHGTFSTSGSDGTINFWDKDAKQRLKCPSSILLPCSDANKASFPFTQLSKPLDL